MKLIIFPFIVIVLDPITLLNLLDHIFYPLHAFITQYEKWNSIMESMSAFEDLTGFVNDGTELRKRLDENSYIFIRGLLPKNTILNIRSRLLERAASGGWLTLLIPSKKVWLIWRRPAKTLKNSI